jgi:restriction system protein
MARYWVIAPYDSTQPSVWERVWKLNVADGFISVGWRDFGDTYGQSEPELRATSEKHSVSPMSFRMFWNFSREIKEGDIVLARQGRKKIAGVGTVLRTAYYDPRKNTPSLQAKNNYPNHIDVQWRTDFVPREFDRIVFGMQTIYEIDDERFRDLVGDLAPIVGIVGTKSADPLPNTEFVLERYLEEFIESNFAAIFGKNLALYREEGVSGRQYMTDVGPIDLLAQDTTTGDFVVIELKKGRESDQVVGQTLRYMGWTKENLCKGNQQVRGMIICKSADARLEYALRMTRDISVSYYRIDFTLTGVPDKRQ